MSVIGTFTPAKDGGWIGTIRTLTIEVKARFVPNDNRDSERAPAFRIFAGRSELGAAWRERTSGENPREYLSVRFDDPGLLEPISAAMFEAADGKTAQLIWSRQRPA
ncbi:DUF736 domain-containing protein [Rhodoligotrophos defluvii]|uniref:DUF736 domain-containing protein n=1 Tax=Rhodoligotrophos defluvii TaxID=2561934 RepID=UPI0010C93D19|nr:DUF736 domain-containing protein [Rhodoligotrophos defluvii]